MQVLRAVDEIIRHQQHLSANQTMRGQMLVVFVHQLALPNRGKSLQCLRVSWALG